MLALCGTGAVASGSVYASGARVPTQLGRQLDRVSVRVEGDRLQRDAAVRIHVGQRRHDAGAGRARIDLQRHFAAQIPVAQHEASGTGLARYELTGAKDAERSRHDVRARRRLALNHVIRGIDGRNAQGYRRAGNGTYDAGPRDESNRRSRRSTAVYEDSVGNGTFATVGGRVHHICPAVAEPAH